MNDSKDLLLDIFAISGAFWILYGVYISFRIQRFIVKRYEQETELLNTVFFTNHAPFSKYLPAFFSSPMYACHLMMCRWGWQYFGSKKVFKDIDTPLYITRHFKKKEMKMVAKHGISLLIILIHGTIFYIFKFLWPDVLN